jgi:plastocyanin
MRNLGRAVLVIATVALAECGGSPGAPSGNDPMVTITATGVSPVEVRVPAGGRVVFLNSDSRVHAISSDPIQLHTDCPAINDVGLLNPGQFQSTGVLTVARTCGYHDHINEDDPTWKGRIIVQ